MPKSSLYGRPVTGASGPRSLSAATRAAAKRAARADERRGDAPPIGAEPLPEQEPVPAPGSAGGRAGRPTDERGGGPGGVPGTEPAGEQRAEPTDKDEPADKDEAADEPGAERAVEGRAARSAGRRNSLLSAVFAVLAVAGLVAASLLAGAYRHDERTGRARTQALSAARTAGPVILSYDYRHLDRDFAAALTHLTGRFREEYRKTTSTVVAPTARRYHGVVKATVAQPPGGDPAASVVSASPDRVVVLLFVNQVTRSTRLDAPRLDLNRVRLTLTRTASGWKVSAVDAL